MRVKIRGDRELCTDLLGLSDDLSEAGAGHHADLQFGVVEAAAVMGIVASTAALADLLFRALETRRLRRGVKNRDLPEVASRANSQVGEVEVVLVVVRYGFSQKTLHLPINMTREQIEEQCEQLES